MNEDHILASETSNDLLFRLEALQPERCANYRVIAQSDKEVRDLQNAPAISMSFFLTDSEQRDLLRTLSVYSERGTSKGEVRLLYMNEVAFSIWKTMGKSPRVIGSRHRPPSTAVLTFGMPFSE